MHWGKGKKNPKKEKAIMIKRDATKICTKIIYSRDTILDP